MSTLTASLHNANIKKLHAGLQTVSARLNSTVTATAASRFLLVQIPDGAVIKNFTFYAKDAGADQVWTLGIQKPEGSTSGSTTTSTSALLGDTSNTGAAGVTTGPVGNKLPFKVSISSEATPRWAWVVANNAIAVSASVDLMCIISYDFDSDL